MRKIIYAFALMALSTTLTWAQGTSCDDATRISASGDVTGTLIGSNQDYYFFTPAADGTVSLTISSPTGCGVRVTTEEVNTNQVGACVGSSSNAIFSNPGTCGGSETDNVDIPVTVGSTYYVRIVRFFAPAPENYTLTVSSTVALPVTLVSQRTQVNKTSVLLEWVTASETENSHFEIEKSKDGEVFQVAGTVYSESANSQTESAYQFEDNSMEAVMYYRISQVDLNGTATVFPIMVAHRQIENDAFRILNAANATYLQYELPNNENVTLSVYDLSGKEVLQQNVTLLSGTHQLLLSDFNLPKGTFVARLNGKTVDFSGLLQRF